MWLIVLMLSTVPASAYDATVRGASCHQAPSPLDQLECEYIIGAGLRFTISGVGELDAATTVWALSPTRDFYLTFSAAHRCIIVKRADFVTHLDDGLAFVSPANGRVYRTLPECKGSLR